MHPILLLVAGAGLLIAGFQAMSETEEKPPKKTLKKKKPKKLANPVPTSDNPPVLDSEPPHVESLTPSPDSVDDIGGSGDGPATGD